MFLIYITDSRLRQPRVETDYSGQPRAPWAGKNNAVLRLREAVVDNLEGPQR